MTTNTTSNNRPTRRFLAEYFHDDAKWMVDIYAYDFDDAEVRCRKLGLQLLGEHQMTIPAVGGSWIPSLIVKVRNWIHALDLMFGRKGF